jgi:predicted DNA-binding transcriptional regulator AlpA
MSELPQLLTTSDVAAITRAPVSTVRYWRHRGTGPAAFRLGRRVVYLGEDVETWLQDRRHEAPTPTTPAERGV